TRPVANWAPASAGATMTLRMWPSPSPRGRATRASARSRRGSRRRARQRRARAPDLRCFFRCFDALIRRGPPHDEQLTDVLHRRRIEFGADSLQKRLAHVALRENPHLDELV